MNKKHLHKIIMESLDKVLNEDAGYHFPEWFDTSTIENGRVRLYHGLRYENLDYVLTEEKLSPKVCAEGCYGLWFTTKNANDYASGYPCLITITVPIEDFKNGRFHVMNRTHVLTTKDIPTDGEYEFEVLKIGRFRLKDKRQMDNLRTMFEKDPKGIDAMFEKEFDYSSLYYFLKDYILEY